MDEDLRPLLGKQKVYTESVNMLHLPFTPGGKIKQHTVHNELPLDAMLMNDNVNGTNLAERMANADIQPTNENDGVHSKTGERNSNTAMEEDHDDNSINFDYVIESISINPRAFTFQQITMSPTEAATRKLTHVEDQAVHRIWKVFKYGIAICAEAVRISSSLQAPDYLQVLQIDHFD